VSDPATTARTARESLSRGLNALQSDARLPPALLELAAPIAQAMGALHQIERTQGAQIAPHAQIALDGVRKALAALQAAPSSYDSVVAAMESVASSLGQIHALSKLAAAPAPQAAAPAPAAPPAYLRPTPSPIQQAPVQPAPPAYARPTPSPMQQAPAPQPPIQQTAPMSPPAAAPPAAHPGQATAFGGAPAPPAAYAPQQAAPPARHASAPAFPSPQGAPAPYAPSPPAPAAFPGVPVARDPFAAPPPAMPAVIPNAPPQPGASVVSADLGAQSTTNFYKGLSGNDIIDHGGLFVSTYMIPKIGTPVRLHVSLPGGYEFEANAVVRWRREQSDGSDAPPGFGAQFTQITMEARQLVYRYVRNREPLFHDDL